MVLDSVVGCPAEVWIYEETRAFPGVTCLEIGKASVKGVVWLSFMRPTSFEFSLSAEEILARA